MASTAFFTAHAQDISISQLWADGGGLYASKFGVPTVVDGSGNFYKAGFIKQSLGGTDAKLQKLDEEGDLLWTATLNTPSQDLYEPTQIVINGSHVYITGIVTYATSGQSDFFLSRVEVAGAVDWFVVDSASGNDVTADIIYDPNTTTLYICGTTQRSGTYDLLLASYDDGGNQQWLTTYDYNNNADVGVKLELGGSGLTVNGSSQSSTTDWDITVWDYTTSGTFVSEQRNTGTGTSSDELKDGALNNGYLTLTGSSLSGTDTDLKVVCLDANNNFLWDDTYDKNSLNDEGTALVTSANGFVVAGYVTAAANNENIFVRKYDFSGSITWTKEINKTGGNDRGIDVIEDNEGNYLVLADVTENGQTDVYLYCLSGTNGNELWNEQIGQYPTLSETGQSIEAGFDGKIYVTYEVANEFYTEAYSYGEVDFPLDDEPFSRGSFYIENNGQLRDTNNVSVQNIKYYSFGLSPEYYFADEYISTLVSNASTNQLQRIDFEFVNADDAHVGEVEAYEKETHFNYYIGQEAYELQATHDVLAWPDIYDNINAFASTNSEGFKLTFVLESGSDPDDIVFDIQGISSFSLTGGSVGGDLHVATVGNDLVWLSPFSFERNAQEIQDDDCIEYQVVDGKLKLRYTCQGEMTFPYVVQLRMGVGQAYSVSKIDNMDWSTFFGGDKDDGAFSVTLDAHKNIYVAGFTSSTKLNTEGRNLSNGGVNVSNLKSNIPEQGMFIRFNASSMRIKYITILEDRSIIKGIVAYDNLPGAEPQNTTPDEIHVVGEFTGFYSDFDSRQIFGFSFLSGINGINPRDVFFASFHGFNGLKFYLSGFGGDGTEHVHGLSILDNGNNNGVLYFVGDTDHGSQAGASSRKAPFDPNDPNVIGLFPVFDPPSPDNSFFSFQHSAQGSKRGFVAALNLTDYQLDYSSILPDFEIVYDINIGATSAYCGKGINDAKIGRWQPANDIFSHTSSERSFSNIDYLSAVDQTNDGHVFFGLNETQTSALLTSKPPFPSFQTSSGESYLVRLVDGNGTPVWDTYFGQSANQISQWGSFNPLIGVTPGNVVFNPGTTTIFAGATAASSAVQTKLKSGFFLQNTIGSSSTLPDMYVASFASNFWAKNFFNWSTIYGGNSNDHMTDIITYEENGEQYLITVGISLSEDGSTSINDVDDYPVANLGGTSHFQMGNSTPLSNGFSDVVITRFKIDDVNISLNEKLVKEEGIRVFPNPTNSIIQIQRTIPDIKTFSVNIYDSMGKCMLEKEMNVVGDNTLTLDLTYFAAGVYTINVNNKYNAKVIKL